jgi:tRNA(fMet)-specific endonuclease VapC
MLLLDTDVMIDIMRNYAPAIRWLRELAADELALPGLTAMALLQGCRDKAEQQRVEAVLRRYLLYWPEPADCAHAYTNFARFHLSDGLTILDALIAATAAGWRQRVDWRRPRPGRGRLH